IAGFGVAAAIARRELAEMSRLATLRDRIEADVLRIAPDATIFSSGSKRLPNTICVSVPAMSAGALLRAFDLGGGSLSAGSACSSGKMEGSHVLTAMGVAPERAGAAIRVSLGWNSTEGDADRFSAAWHRIYSKFQERRRAA